VLNCLLGIGVAPVVGVQPRKTLIVGQLWSHPPGSNRRPADYESAALPAELGWPFCLVSILANHGLTSILNRQHQYYERVKFSLVLLLTTIVACRTASKTLVDPALAVYMPANATVLAGIDLDRLRTSPLFGKIPRPFRDGSYTLVGYNGKDLVTAARAGSKVTVSGPVLKGSPPDLLRYASDAPIWIVARGSSALPLSGNLANLNRLLEQTDYTTVSARVADSVDVEIEGVCASPEIAQHLEQNTRAIASLLQLPLGLRREGRIVYATGSISVEAAGKLL
jgi:hypothetical protein